MLVSAGGAGGFGLTPPRLDVYGWSRRQEVEPVGRFNQFVCVALSALMLGNAAGCTKRVAVPADQYSDVVGGEDFVRVTTTSGDVYQLQEAQLAGDRISGLLRHEGGDVKPVGLGGKEDRTAYVEIRLEDVRSIEVERINKKRLLLAFGVVGAGLIGAIALVKATGTSGDGGGGGGLPGGKGGF